MLRQMFTLNPLPCGTSHGLHESVVLQIHCQLVIQLNHITVCVHLPTWLKQRFLLISKVLIENQTSTGRGLKQPKIYLSKN